MSDVEHEQPDWLSYAASEWGYGRIRVRGGSELFFEFVLSEDGSVADSVRLHSARSQQRVCSPATFQQQPALSPASHLRMPAEQHEAISTL